MRLKKDSNSKFIRPQSLKEDKKNTRFRKYKDISIGDKGFGYFLKYEIIQFLLSNLSGALGLYLRQRFYRHLFKEMGERSVIGKSLCMRQPQKISIGKGCIIDDYTRITVSGSEDACINIGNDTFIGPYTIISSKDACIDIKDYVNIGSHSRIASTEGKISIGRYALIASFCYIGGGNHITKDVNIPIALQGLESKGGVLIEDDVWIGAKVTILDGVKIGKGSIIGTGSVVLNDIPSYSIVYGTPATVRGHRR